MLKVTLTQAGKALVISVEMYYPLSKIEPPLPFARLFDDLKRYASATDPEVRPIVILHNSGNRI